MTTDLDARAMAMLISELDQATGDLEVLAKALRDIEAIAQDEMDLDRHDLSSILHICRTPRGQRRDGTRVSRRKPRPLLDQEETT